MWNDFPEISWYCYWMQVPIFPVIRFFFFFNMAKRKLNHLVKIASFSTFFFPWSRWQYGFSLEYLLPGSSKWSIWPEILVTHSSMTVKQNNYSIFFKTLLQKSHFYLGTFQIIKYAPQIFFSSLPSENIKWKKNQIDFLTVWWIFSCWFTSKCHCIEKMSELTLDMDGHRVLLGGGGDHSKLKTAFTTYINFLSKNFTLAPPPHLFFRNHIRTYSPQYLVYLTPIF